MGILKKENKNISWLSDKDIIAPKDDLFAKLSEDVSMESVTEVPIEKLMPHHNHAYKVKDDAEMDELIDSIKQNGIISPILVRKYKDGYEIISGHRRHHASEKAGLKSVPCIVLDIDDDTSDIYMNQSNKYRENILPSEKAWGYRIEFDARKRQGSLPQDLEVYDQIADNGTDSVSTIKRLIRLTYLDKSLLDMVDEGKKLKTSQGVLLSKLSEEEQKAVLDSLNSGEKPLTLKHAEKLRDMHDQRKKITKEIVDGLIGNTFTPRTAKEKAPSKDFTSYLPDTIKALPKEKQTAYIVEAIKNYAEYITKNPSELDKFV